MAELKRESGSTYVQHSSHDSRLMNVTLILNSTILFIGGHEIMVVIVLF